MFCYVLWIFVKGTVTSYAIFYYLINSIYQGYHSIGYFFFLVSEVFILLRKIEKMMCMEQCSGTE